MSDPVNFNTASNNIAKRIENSLPDSNIVQIDPVASNLTKIDGYSSLPHDVQVMLYASGSFSLTPVDGWIKTVLPSPQLATAFKGDTIYTPPTSDMDYFNSFRVAQENKGIFDDFLSVLFSVDDTQSQDSYSNSSSDSYDPLSLLNFGNYQK